MAPFDTRQLNEELNKGFSTLVDLLGWSMSILYQQMATANGFENEWVNTSLVNLAATIELGQSRAQKTQFSEAYVQKLRSLARQFEDPAPVSLTIIEGGRNNSEPS